MNRNPIRLAVGAIAMLACLAFGTPSAFAWNGQPRVHAAGYFFHNDINNVNGGFSDKVKIGLNGRCSDNGATIDATTGNMTCTGTDPKLGEYEYYNEFTTLQAHGHVQSLVFEPYGDPACSAIATGPAAKIKGGGTCSGAQCTDQFGTHQYNFEITVIDGDDNPSSPGQDGVCNVFVSGYTKSKTPAADGDTGGNLVKGDVEVTTTGQNNNHK